MLTSPVPTILIVDDDEGHAILIRENLEAAGLRHPIRHFRDGQAILDFFASRRNAQPETFLVLLDIRMPKIDGIEVLRRLKADLQMELTAFKNAAFAAGYNAGKGEVVAFATRQYV